MRISFATICGSFSAFRPNDDFLIFLAETSSSLSTFYLLSTFYFVFATARQPQTSRRICSSVSNLHWFVFLSWITTIQSFSNAKDSQTVCPLPYKSCPPSSLPAQHNSKVPRSTYCDICIRPVSTPSDIIRRSSCNPFVIYENLAVTTQGPTGNLACQDEHFVYFCSISPGTLDPWMSFSVSVGGYSILFGPIPNFHS